MKSEAEGHEEYSAGLSLRAGFGPIVPCTIYLPPTILRAGNPCPKAQHAEAPTPRLGPMVTATG